MITGEPNNLWVGKPPALSQVYLTLEIMSRQMPALVTNFFLELDRLVTATMLEPFCVLVTFSWLDNHSSQ